MKKVSLSVLVLTAAVAVTSSAEAWELGGAVHPGMLDNVQLAGAAVASDIEAMAIAEAEQQAAEEAPFLDVFEEGALCMETVLAEAVSSTRTDVDPTATTRPPRFLHAPIFSTVSSSSSACSACIA